jgi:hypothetical protein
MARWKPKTDDKYWCLDLPSHIKKLYWHNDNANKFNYEMGNCFRTKGEAKKALEKLKETLIEFHKEIENE